ncbi:MAG: type II toxin-antitoxin system VapC family toxin [Gammaproteobacteria bacterium]|nr:type II toxin-antitoxin system VapC family toxin [Gammaproteobacteria bacterium]
MVYLDSCIVIYWVEEKASQLESLRQAFISLGEEDIACSPLVQLECLVYPYRTGNKQLLARYRQFFADALCLPLTEAVFDIAAQLRANHPNLKTPDAVHLACTQYHQCRALWTNDDRLAKMEHNLAVNIIKRYKT